MRNLIFTVLYVLLAHGSAMAQTDSTTANLTESRNKAIRQLINYRYKGGAGAFERTFYANVKYTPEAIRNCIIGTVILSFSVDCNNNIIDFIIRNPLHSGINEQLQAFIKATEGQWNTCKDDKYTQFEVPVLFTLGGTETAATGFIVLEGETPGYKCKSDAYYMEQFEKYSKKGKTRSALTALDMLIRRNPYDANLYELKKNLLTNSK